MIRILAAVAILAVLPLSVAAQGCEGRTQIEINSCAKQRWESADRELNRLWGVLKPMADTRGRGRQLL